MGPVAQGTPKHRKISHEKLMMTKMKSRRNVGREGGRVERRSGAGRGRRGERGGIGRGDSGGGTRTKGEAAEEGEGGGEGKMK